mgnify:FL=1
MENKNLMQIPRYIHYCWFGNASLPIEYKKYIEGWEKFFPEYKIICWSEKNFPLQEFSYAKEAARAGKWAFVSDVARIYALKKYGGIYFDTDVEVKKSFNDILENQSAILGTEDVSQNSIGTGFMAFIPEHPICCQMLKYYNNNYFINKDGTLNMVPNTHIMANILYKLYGVRPSNNIQKLDECIVYPQEFFTAYDGKLGKNMITENTYCVHHFKGSWASNKDKIKNSLRKIKNRIIYRCKEFI